MIEKLNEKNQEQSDRIKLLKIELNKQIKENDRLQLKVNNQEKHIIHQKNKWHIEQKLI